MPQSDSNGHRLVPLEGELPPSGKAEITIFLCCHRSELEQGLVPVLLRINQEQASNPIHCHILDLDADGLAQVNLTAQVCANLRISVTREDVPAFCKDSGSSLAVEFGLLRLQEIYLHVPGRYVLVPLKDAAQLSFRAIDDVLANHSMLIDQEGSGAIAVDSGETAQKGLAAIARPLLDRLQSGELTVGDSARVLKAFMEQVAERNLLSCGDFPLIPNPMDKSEAPPNKATQSLGGIKNRLWDQHGTLKSSRRVLL